MGHAGRFSPCDITVPVNGCCVMAAVPGSTLLLFSGKAGCLLSAITCCHSSSFLSQVAAGPEDRGVLDPFLFPPSQPPLCVPVLWLLRAMLPVLALTGCVFSSSSSALNACPRLLDSSLTSSLPPYHQKCPISRSCVFTIYTTVYPTGLPPT